MKKSEEFAKNGAIILGLGGSILSAIDQLDKMKEDPNLKFNWGELFISTTVASGIGGATGYAIGAFLDHQNQKEKPIDLNKHLMSLSSKLMLDKSDQTYLTLKEGVDKVSSVFKRHFSTQINGELIPHGSTEKGTALHDSYDIDIAVPFKPKSFANNEEMYSEVLNFFSERIGKLNIIDVREQKRSIGVCLELNEREHWVDFAPYKLSKDDNGSGYLYVNRKSFLTNNSTIQKTDLAKLKKNNFSDAQRRIIVLLKDWRIRYGLSLPSHFLEYLVKDAYQFNKGLIPKTIEKKMILILKHMAERLHVIYIRGDENTNNIISNSIDISEKELIIDACKSAIRQYEYQPNSLVKSFN